MIAGSTAKQTALRTSGVVAIAASLASAVADVSLLYPAVAAAQKGQVLSLAGGAPWRLLLGHYLGIFTIPLQIAGYWQLYQALKPAGRMYALPMFLLGVYLLSYGTALHGSFAPYAVVSQARDSAGATQAHAPLAAVLSDLWYYFAPLALAVLLGQVLMSALYVLAILRRPTHLPRWMPLCNKLFLLLLVALVTWSLPEPAARFLFPASTNLTNLLFFGTTTAFMGNADV